MRREGRPAQLARAAPWCIASRAVRGPCVRTGEPSPSATMSSHRGFGAEPLAVGLCVPPPNHDGNALAGIVGEAPDLGLLVGRHEPLQEEPSGGSAAIACSPVVREPEGMREQSGRASGSADGTTALLLGLGGVLLLGAFLGVPAILLGRGAERDAEVVRRAEGARGRGPTVLPPRSTAARVGILLGWVSVLETAALAAFLFTRGWPSAVCATGLAATGLVLLGLGAAENLPVPITTLTRTLRRTPLAVGLPLAGVILGSVLGRVAAHRADMAI